MSAFEIPHFEQFLLEVIDLARYGEGVSLLEEDGDVKSMKDIRQMIRMYEDGWSISEIATTLQVDWKTVKKYVEHEDFSETFPQALARASNLDPFKPTIHEWLAEDLRVRRKQRHTAERIHQRLQHEFPDTFTLSYSTVQRYLKRIREARTTSSKGTLELVWAPGTAQVDFGTADAYWHPGDPVTTVKYLTVSFPFSNAGLLQYFPGETAECVVHGLQAIWQWLGGVPHRVVFDNATGIGRRVGDVIRYAELFERFQAHYGFEATFCNPDAGHEKGNVEAKVGYLRRTVMVPPPILEDWPTANQQILPVCEQLWQRPHYKKGLAIAQLFDVDREHLRALPARAFQPVRFTRVHTDGYGKVCLEGKHWYSTAPEWARQELVVQIGAFTVVPYTPDGTPITTHARQYGDVRTDTIDPRTTLHRLSRNPGAWRNSPVREWLPEELVDTFDHAAREDLKGCLRALADLTERFGFDHALQALQAAVHHHQISYADITVRAARMAYWDPVDPSSVDLNTYDVLIPEGSHD